MDRARYAGGWRDPRAAAGARDRFISFIAASSMAGIALGVAALIVVLSVMNGFQTEVRDRMLSVLPHIELYVPRSDRGTALAAMAAPRRAGQEKSQGTGRRALCGCAGHDSARPSAARRAGARYRPQAKALGLGHRRANERGRYRSTLQAGQLWHGAGQQMANALGVRMGDTVLMLAPQGSVSPAGFTPRMRQFTVTGIFSGRPLRIRLQPGVHQR